MGNCVSGTKTVTVEPPLRTSSALEIPVTKACPVDRLNENEKSEAKIDKERSHESLELQSMSVSDEFESTELDLSFSKEESEAEASTHSDPSSCSAVYTRSNSSNYTRRSTLSSFTNSTSSKRSNTVDTVMPKSEYSVDENSRSSQVLSSRSSQNSDGLSLDNLPRVTESGNLDLESFQEIVMSKIRKLSASTNDKAKRNKAIRLIHRLDKAVVEAMNKVKRSHARRSAKVSPAIFAQDDRGEQRTLQSNEGKAAENSGCNILVVSDCEEN